MNRRHASPPHFEFARQKRKHDSCISISLMLEVFWIDDLKCLPCSILMSSMVVDSWITMFSYTNQAVVLCMRCMYAISLTYLFEKHCLAHIDILWKLSVMLSAIWFFSAFVRHHLVLVSYEHRILIQASCHESNVLPGNQPWTGPLFSKKIHYIWT